MTTALRAVTAFLILGAATPALPCPSMKTTQAEAPQPAKEKEKVAKSEKAPKPQAGKDGAAQKPAPTAAN